MQNIRNIILVGPSLEPVTGQSVAFSAVKRRYGASRVFHINKGSGVVNILWGMLTCLKYLFSMRLGNKKIYITISRTRYGFLRDVFFINVGRLFNSRIIIHLHGGDMIRFRESVFGTYKRLIEKTIEKVDIAIVLGESLRKEFSWCLPEEKIAIVENFYEHPKGLNTSKMIRRRWDSKEIRILFMSNVLPSKGLVQLLEGVKIGKYSDRVRIRFAGKIMKEGKYKQSEIEKVLNEYEGDCRVKFECIGFLKGAEKWKELYSSHILALPSNNECEGQPICIIEGMAAGCAILASDYGGIGDIVNEYENGVFCNPKKVLSVSKKIEWLYENRGNLEKMSKENTCVAMRRFAKERYLSKICKIIEQ